MQIPMRVHTANGDVDDDRLHGLRVKEGDLKVVHRVINVPSNRHWCYVVRRSGSSLCSARQTLLCVS
jgi:hypothetical protein